MDCLDRTNVVQGVIARNVMHEILRKSKLFIKDSTSPFAKFPKELELAFRNIWTNNADQMSFLYSGTGALKTDFTRTGKRTFLGALNDGRNSIKRYFINNFFDAYNQNSIDLILGKLVPVNTPYKKPILNYVWLFVILVRFLLAIFNVI